MIEPEDKILTWHPAGKKGVYIYKRDYLILRNFICAALKKQEISILELIGLGESELANKLGYGVSWGILVVKLDLEARGFLLSKAKPAPYPVQYLKLRPGALKKMKAYSSPWLVVE